MKRRTRQWGRILFNTLTAISLLLAIATAGLWVRSGYFSERYVQNHLADDRLTGVSRAVGIRQGVFFLTITEKKWQRTLPPSFVRNVIELGKAEFVTPGYHSQPNVGTGGWRRWAPTIVFFGSIDRKLGMTTFHEYTIPLWLPLLIFLVLPTLRGNELFQARRRRLSIGLCPACGYDTRANPAKCSECGHEMLATTEVESA